MSEVTVVVVAGTVSLETEDGYIEFDSSEWDSVVAQVESKLA